MLANIPATQTVIEISKPGGPEVLVPATRPVPEPTAGEVLSCSPCQVVGTTTSCLFSKLFSMAAVGQSRRHDHEKRRLIML